MHALFERQAALTPDRVALADDGTTFGELDARADRIAGALRALGVRAGDRVAVRMGRGPALPAALLGVLKAGGAYVPIDPGYPPERIAFLLADCGAKTVLTEESVAELLNGPGGPLEPVATATDLAYVIYTSGSTGNPKGVMVEHRSVVNRLAWMQKHTPIGAGDVLLQKTPISFDVSVWELFWWAAEGASVALLPQGAERDPREILRAIRERGVTAVHFVPSMFGPFLDLLETERRDAASLRYVFCSGEALPPARVDQFNRIFQGAGPRLINLYGPTETTVDVSFYDCPADPGRPVERVPIGRAIDGVQLHVLGPDGDPRPEGELCVSGVGVARGYLGRPELTREKFVPAPSVPGGRLYRTGDLARWLPGGDLEYRGRLDDQVKIRGNRVEPGEVQNALLRLPEVGEAVVIDRHTAERGTHLIAFYTADAPLDPAVLRTALARTLPDFMIPAFFQRLEALPLTPNGKADRAALPEVTVASGEGRPSDELETLLTEVWSAALGLPVGVHDTFAGLGGDSMTLLKIRADAERRGVRFTLADLVAADTVAELADLVRNSPAPPAEPAPEPFELVAAVDRAGLQGCADAFPVTRLQHGMLFYSRQEEGSAKYHDVFHYTVAGSGWQEPEFRYAHDQLVERHPALRSSFDLGGRSEPLQLVHHAVESALTVVELGGLSDAEADAAVAEHVQRRRRHRYDFGVAPLYELRVFPRDGRTDLVFAFHHALLDGGSVANLVRELVQDYLAMLGADLDPVEEDDLPSPAGYVRAERRAIASGAAAEHWRRLLDGASLLQLPSFRRHLPPGEAGPTVRRIRLTAEWSAEVTRFARAHDLSLKSLLFAPHCLMLGLFAGSPDVTTGLVTHGRPEQPGADRIAGLFLNTLPFRLTGGGLSGLEIVRELQRQEREAHPHRHYPLSEIQRERGDAVVETAFNYVHFRQLAEVAELAAASVDLEVWEETHLALLTNAQVDPVTGELAVRLDLDAAFAPEQADLLAETYLALLRRIVDEPDAIPDLALRDAPERARRPLPEAPDVIRLFTAHAEAAPDATAVVHGSRAWTYRELDQASGALAARLRAAHPEPGFRVGVAMERSPEQIAAVLGVVRAGGACVPLDPAYPQARRDAMRALARPVEVIEALEPAASSDQGAPPLRPSDPAYVLFTSGSTGEPKGVVMPHRGLAGLVRWQNARESAALGGRTLQFAPLGFDVSFQEIFSTLCGGGTLHLLDEEDRRDPAALLRLIADERIERIFLPSVLLQRLAEAGERPAALRVLVSSGEQLKITDEIRRFCGDDALLENQYGPTESHVVTAFPMRGSLPELPPIGAAIDGADVLVLDERLRPVPPGALGELHLGGDCLADGYLDRPDLTAERFVTDPSGRRLYRTGDLAFALPGGELVCAGRADDQVKIRGFRVEPAEVELALAALPGIREAAVVVRRRAGEAFLAPFLIGTTAPDELLHRLRATLPDHLIPAHREFLDALPLTPSGKRDDATLRARPLRSSSVPSRPPADQHEAAVLALLAGALDLPGLGVQDDIFALGATSLTAMRITVLIEQRYGIRLPMSGFAAAPTAAALAALLHDREAAPFDPLVPLRTSGARRPLFLVHPMGGNVLCYLPLLRHLLADQPLYALQASGVEPGTEPIDSVPELAAAYLEAIRRVRPAGPYSIGGWSFGGTVAVEMAVQLRAAGEEVADLLVLDTMALDPRRGSDDVSEDEILAWFFWELLLLRGGSGAGLWPDGLTRDEKFAEMARRAADAGVVPHAGAETVVRRLYAVYLAHGVASGCYRPELAGHELTLLRAAEPLPDVLRRMHDASGSRHDDPTNGWEPLTGAKVELIGVPGSHLSMVEEPHVAGLARAITEVMGRHG
ncbi:non-ribosomal peptide synthetase [Actinocorallia lasiicapitis]